MFKVTIIMLGMLAGHAGQAFAQSHSNSSSSDEDGDTTVTVPKKYVSSEGLQHTVSPESSQWIGIGREIGIATKEGLESVVDVAQKFGGTNVGRYVMFLVAWKIIGHQLLGVVLGIPMWIAGMALWLFCLRRFFWGVRRLVKKNADKSKEYETVQYEFASGDAKVAVGIAFTLFAVAWCITFAVVVFAS